METVQDIVKDLIRKFLSDDRSSDAIAAIESTTKQLLSKCFHDRDVKNLRPRTKSLVQDEQKAPFWGIIGQDQPSSGAYTGTSLVAFPAGGKILLSLGIGSAGLGDDAELVGRPGHVRWLKGIRDLHAGMWVKEDPANLTLRVPKVVTETLQACKSAIEQYSTELYTTYQISTEISDQNVDCFLDLLLFYGQERNWSPKSEFRSWANDRNALWSAQIFKNLPLDRVYQLLRERRFIILEGPPGTGKTFTAERLIGSHYFPMHTKIVQFHANTTYESFVRGIQPSVDSGQLSFTLVPGCLLLYGRPDEDTLLIIDEINRTDLSKVLGEAIYLFENSRFEGATSEVSVGDISINGRLYVIGTMNTADRSVGTIDLAIRRRFAFVKLMPDREIIATKCSDEVKDKALRAFDLISHVFVEHATDEEMNFLPGHSYFITENIAQLSNKLEFEIEPLLRESVLQGWLERVKNEILALCDNLREFRRTELA